MPDSRQFNGSSNKHNEHTTRARAIATAEKVTIPGAAHRLLTQPLALRGLLQRQGSSLLQQRTASVGSAFATRDCASRALTSFRWTGQRESECAH